ncbi:MAG: tyrosine-type recombinase/integrase, partial [Enterobacter ludwigii]|nr:tyrosine-type recombinase/integrase [Enterobacter ludwigii]
MKQRLYLTRHEVAILAKAAFGGKNGVRDYCMLLLCYLHGFRTSELTGLKLSDLDLSGGRLSISRLKNGFSTVHPLHTQARKALSTWLYTRQQLINDSDIPWLFISRKGGRLSRQRFYMICKEHGRLAGLPFNVHPH